jgi:hypothetical protein
MSNGEVTPKTVSKGSAYGFLDIMPWKEDIISPPSLGIPHIMVGLPLSGKVLNSPFFGAGEAFNLAKLPKAGTALSKVIPFSIRVYGGVALNKQFGPVTSPSVSPPSHWSREPQYGIEFSVREIASKLTAKASAKGTATTTSKSGAKQTSP